MKKGISLMELLAVIVIMGILAGIAIPLVTNSINFAKATSYNTDGKISILALNTYCLENESKLLCLEEKENNITDKKYYLDSYYTSSFDDNVLEDFKYYTSLNYESTYANAYAGYDSNGLYVFLSKDSEEGIKYHLNGESVEEEPIASISLKTILNNTDNSTFYTNDEFDAALEEATDQLDDLPTIDTVQVDVNFDNTVNNKTIFQDSSVNALINSEIIGSTIIFGNSYLSFTTPQTFTFNDATINTGIATVKGPRIDNNDSDVYTNLNILNSTINSEFRIERGFDSIIINNSELYAIRNSAGTGTYINNLVINNSNIYRGLDLEDAEINNLTISGNSVIARKFNKNSVWNGNYPIKYADCDEGVLMEELISKQFDTLNTNTEAANIFTNNYMTQDEVDTTKMFFHESISRSSVMISKYNNVGNNNIVISDNAVVELVPKAECYITITGKTILYLKNDEMSYGTVHLTLNSSDAVVYITDLDSVVIDSSSSSPLNYFTSETINS